MNHSLEPNRDKSQPGSEHSECFGKCQASRQEPLLTTSHCAAWCCKRSRQAAGNSDPRDSCYEGESWDKGACGRREPRPGQGEVLLCRPCFGHKDPCDLSMRRQPWQIYQEGKLECQCFSGPCPLEAQARPEIFPRGHSRTASRLICGASAVCLHTLG